MDSKLLETLGLNSSINSNDLQILNQILNSSGKNLPKISNRDKNNLINKLSSTNTLNNIPTKELKDMNEEEKIIYRKELKKKLKDKQLLKKNIRTNYLAKNNSNINNDDTSLNNTDLNNNLNNNNLNNALDKINEIIKNNDLSDIIHKDDIENDIIHKDNNDDIDNLDNYLN